MREQKGRGRPVNHIVDLRGKTARKWRVMIKKSIQEKKGLLIFLFFCLSTLVLRLFYISKVNGPFVYADEFGYWAHAAHLAGHTWAGVMDGIGWYNFGYSFILAPAFFLSNNMSVIYKIAVLFNAFMSIGIYGIAYLISRRIFPTLDELRRGMAAFAATSFSTYIFYSYVTLCETLLTLLVWFIFYEIVSIEEKPTWQKCFFLGAAAGIAYMTHNRMLSVIIATAFCMILFVVQHKISWKEIMIWGIALAFIAVLNGILKVHFVKLIEENHVLSELGVSVGLGSANTMGGQTQKILGLFSVNGFKEFILNVAGQLWECLSATYLLFGYGVVYAVGKMWRHMKSHKNIGVYLFPVLAMLLSVAISGVFFYENAMDQTAGAVRIDRLFYGRYNACFLGFLILLGIGLLAGEQKKQWKIYLAVAAVYIGLAVVMSIRLGGVGDKYLNVVSAVGIHIFHWLGEFEVWKCALAALLGAVVITGLCQIRLSHHLQQYMACLFLVFLFSTTALHCMRLCIRGENDNTARYTEIFDYLRENTEENEVIYICERDKMAYDVQSRLADRVVVSLSFDQLSQIMPESYVIVREENEDKIPAEEYRICMEKEGYRVIAGRK